MSDNKSAIEVRPSFVFLVNNWPDIGAIDRAHAVQALLNEGYSGRHLANRLTAAGIAVDEGTIRRDSLVARLPESSKDLIRSGVSTTAVLKKAKAEGVLDELAGPSSSEPEQQNAVSPNSEPQKEPVPTDQASYLQAMHESTQRIGAALNEQHKRELAQRAQRLAHQFRSLDGTPLSRQERLERIHENTAHIQDDLDARRRQLQEYRSRMRFRQFGRNR